MKLFLTLILRSVYILSIFFVAVFLVCTFNTSFAAPAPSVESIWMEGAALPSPRTEIIAANLEEAVHVIGGFTLDGRLQTLATCTIPLIIPGFIT
jgi:hypothetical protein